MLRAMDLRVEVRRLPETWSTGYKGDVISFRCEIKDVRQEKRFIARKGNLGVSRYNVSLPAWP